MIIVPHLPRQMLKTVYFATDDRPHWSWGCWLLHVFSLSLYLALSLVSSLTGLHWWLMMAIIVPAHTVHLGTSYSVIFFAPLATVNHSCSGWATVYLTKWLTTDELPLIWVLGCNEGDLDYWWYTHFLPVPSSLSLSLSLSRRTRSEQRRKRESFFFLFTRREEWNFASSDGYQAG